MAHLLPYRRIPAFNHLLRTTQTYAGQANLRHLQISKSPGLGQRRAASILGSLSDNRGAYNKRIRRGRGPASGKGKTSGRGHKGQKQHGKVPAGFTGGQTPLEVVKGRRGYENQFSIDLVPLNVDRLQSWIDQGRLDNTRPITLRELHESRCLHGVKDGIKLLARNAEALRSPVNITVSRASATAIAAIEAAGGSVTTRYYTRPSIRRILCGLTHPTTSLMSRPTLGAQSDNQMNGEPVFLKSQSGNITRAVQDGMPPPEAYRYRLPDATSRKDIEYYRDPAHRGYLSYQVAEGQGPSLFFRTTNTVSSGEKGRERKNKTGATATEGRIW